MGNKKLAQNKPGKATGQGFGPRGSANIVSPTRFFNPNETGRDPLVDKMGNPIKGAKGKRSVFTGVSSLGRVIPRTGRASASGIRPDHPFAKPVPNTTRTSVPKRKAGGAVGPRGTKNIEVPNPNPPAISIPFGESQKASQGLIRKEKDV